MLDGVVVGNGERGGDADPVVGAECRSVRKHPVVLDADVDPALARVELTVGIALADDVQVRLEDDDGSTLAPGRRSHLHEDVALGVRPGSERPRGRPREHVVPRRPLRLRRPGDACQLGEALPEERRLEPSQRISHRRSVSAAPTTSSPIPSTRSQENPIRSTPNHP